MKNNDRDLFFRSIVARQCVVLNLKKYQLADNIGMPHSTFYMKMRYPSRFSVGEMRDICQFLKFSVDDKTSII